MAQRHQRPLFQLQLPCRLHGDQAGWRAEGMTLNITREGAQIECTPDGSPEEGDLVVFDVALPNSEWSKRCFHGKARVVKVGPLLGRIVRLELAFVSLQFRFWESGEPVDFGAGPGAGMRT